MSVVLFSCMTILHLLGAVTLDLFPKLPIAEIAWVGFAPGCYHFHVCGYTAINCPRGRKILSPVRCNR